MSRAAACLLTGLIWILTSGSASAQGTCVFEYDQAVMRLLDDCATDAPILVPDGSTLDGQGHVIWVVDPPDGVFQGGMVTNVGAVASVVDLTIVAAGLSPRCQTGARRLRGILLEGASGVVRGNRILNVTRGLSACDEGHGIEVRTTDEEAPPLVVEIAGNVIEGYQKAGVVIAGRVDAWIHHNEVGASAVQAYLPANALQIGGGAFATVEENRIAGNSWPHPDAAGTGILLLGSAPGTVVRGNAVVGNADVGIYVAADGVTVAYNRVEETGPDGYYDIGIGNYGRDNLFVGNVVRGYTTSYQNVPGEEDAAGSTLAQQPRPPR
jgi:nitrous oxidase accessory protein NosD